MMRTKIVFVFVIISSLITSCKVRDLRTDYAKENITKTQEDLGRQLLKDSYLAMGYENLENVKTYKAKSLFDWRWPWSWMPMNALPGNKCNIVEFKFATHTFDGQIDYLEGRKKGETFGLQSWQSYKLNKDKTVKKVKGKRRKWGLAAYHYIIEAPMRIHSAEIIRYAGKKEFEGQTYDLVFVTWGQDEPHKEHDQYLMYINTQTKMVDVMEITINDFFLPVPNSMKDGAIRIERKKTDIGAYMPSSITIQLGKPKKQKKHVYQFSLYDYKFDEVPEYRLYPIKDLGKVGDVKESN